MPERPGAGVARGGEDRRDEDEMCARMPGKGEFGLVVGRSGERPARLRFDARALAAAPMLAGMQGGREVRVPRDHECQSPGAAEGGDVLAEGGAVGRCVIPEDHAAKTFWQLGDKGGAGAARGIRKEPERGQGPAPLYPARPGQ